MKSNAVKHQNQRTVEMMNKAGLDQDFLCRYSFLFFKSEESSSHSPLLFYNVCVFSLRPKMFCFHALDFFF